MGRLPWSVSSAERNPQHRQYQFARMAQLKLLCAIWPLSDLGLSYLVTISKGTSDGGGETRAGRRRVGAAPEIGGVLVVADEQGAALREPPRGRSTTQRRAGNRGAPVTRSRFSLPMRRRCGTYGWVGTASAPVGLSSPRSKHSCCGCSGSDGGARPRRLPASPRAAWYHGLRSRDHDRQWAASRLDQQARFTSRWPRSVGFGQ